MKTLNSSLAKTQRPQRTAKKKGVFFRFKKCRHFFARFASRLKCAYFWLRENAFALFLFTLAFVALLIIASPASAELRAHIAAAVNNEVITSIDLEQAVRFNAALGAAGTGDAKKLEQETLEGLINRQLLLQEARRLRFVEMSDQDTDAELGKLIKRLGTEKDFTEFLAGTGLTRAEVRHMLAERLVVERFVEKKVGLFVRVTRDEAQAYFDGHAAEFKGKRFADVQKKINTLLMEQRLGQQVDRYLAELRAKADVRVNP